MKYQTPAQMRAALLKIIKGDDALVDATVDEYFRSAARRQREPEPVSGKKVNPTYREKMIKGSDQLACAIEAMLHGLKPPETTGFQWKMTTGGHSPASINFRDENAKLRGEEIIAMRTATAEKARVAALMVPSGFPCGYCGAARACEHRSC
jgi:hypothetical protein